MHLRSAQSTPLVGVVLPLDPHLVVIATKLLLKPSDQLSLFPSIALDR